MDSFYDADGKEYVTPLETVERPSLRRPKSIATIVKAKQNKVKQLPSSDDEEEYEQILKDKKEKQKIQATKRPFENAFKPSTDLTPKKKKDESPAKYAPSKLQKEILQNIGEPFLDLPEQKEEETIKYPLVETVIQHVKRLKGTLPTGNEARRHYSRNQMLIPREIQFFLDIKWPTKKSMGESVTLRVKNDDFQVYELEFIEYDLVQWDDYKFLRTHPDACLVGDGNVVICTLLNQENLSDFDIYLLDDEDKEGVEGPFRISEFLSKTVLDDGLRVK